MGRDAHDIAPSARLGMHGRFASVGPRPYDHAVDPITARRVLRIVPDSPLTVELIERAYAGEAWARHPSRYAEDSARHDAEEWAQTLATARGVLLAEAQSPPASRTDAAAAPSAPRRRLSGGAIAGIVAGGVALIALVTFAAIGAANLLTEAVTTATATLESEAPDAASGGSDSGDTEFADVERYQSGETMFEFYSALEIYNDGRYGAECPSEYSQGCWQMALFTEADCDAMEIELAFTNDFEAILPDHRETIEKHDVLSNEATVVVFGNDEHAYGWINQVTCLDPVS
jgi:hypothetical protein